MLLVWARGMVFARINGLPYTASSWWGLRWGALIRRETKSRLYLGYFKETSLWKQALLKFQLPFRKLVYEPGVNKLPFNENNLNQVYVFNKVITHEDLFGSIRNHQRLVVQELYSLLTSKMKAKLKDYKSPVIGIHIRRGDFKMGKQTTPLDYFINAIILIRQSVNENLPVTIFTDADKHELSELLKLPNIFIAEEKPDILDILLLSKSKIMVLSKSSTFGYWAAFLSDALVIRPHYDWQEMIKENKKENNYFEIKWNPEDELVTTKLLEKIKATDLKF